jgi:T-complex protein 1 subunit theta
MGPNGMNKMVINHLEKLFLTNDAATIMKELEVFHPAAKLLAMASQQQESELGDATNLVVVFAGELLSKAESLLRMGLHIADVIEGFERASKVELSLLDNLVMDKITDMHNEEQLMKVVRVAVGSKQIGLEKFISSLVVKAALAIMPSNPKNFNVDNIRVVKILGGSLSDSAVVRGMVFPREPESDLKKAYKAKVAIYSCSLDIQRTETKGTVLLKNAGELLNFSTNEEKHLEKMIREIAESGVKVIVVSSGVGDMALHYANRMGLVVVKVLSKFDIRRLAKVTGACPMTRLGAPTAEEMGFCDVVEYVEIGSDKCTIFRQEAEETRTVTIVLRGNTQNGLDDLERAIDDGVNVIKAISKDPRLVVGGGCCEIALASELLKVAEKVPDISQHAIKAYAEAFEVVPRTLAENAGLDGTEVVSQLYASYANGSKSTGVDVEGEFITGTKDMLIGDYQILDCLATKLNALRLAADAALTVLRIDQIIMSKPAGGPKVPKGSNSFDEDD